jgi:hypothetical protein
MSTIQELGAFLSREAQAVEDLPVPALVPTAATDGELTSS